MPLYQSWWVWVVVAWCFGVLIGALASFLLLQRRQAQLLRESDDLEHELADVQNRLDTALGELKTQAASVKSAFSGQTILQATLQVREDEFKTKASDLEEALRARAGLETILKVRDAELAELHERLDKANADLKELLTMQTDAGHGDDGDGAGHPEVEADAGNGQGPADQNQERVAALEAELASLREVAEESERQCALLRAELEQAAPARWLTHLAVAKTE